MQGQEMAPAPPSPTRCAQQAARVHRTQANQQGSWNPPQVPATEPGCFATATPVQAGTSVSLEILSEGLTCQQLLNRSIARAAAMVAGANEHSRRASSEPSSKCPPSSPPDGPAKCSHASSLA